MDKEEGKSLLAATDPTICCPVDVIKLAIILTPLALSQFLMVRNHNERDIGRDCRGRMRACRLMKRAEEKRGRVTVTDFYPTWQLLIFKTVPESQFSFDVC